MAPSVIKVPAVPALGARVLGMSSVDDVDGRYAEVYLEVYLGRIT